MNTNQILKDLQNIVGKEFATNSPEDLYIYSQDPGASLPRPVDFVVMPKTTEEVQKIVRLANEEKIPLVPMGGGLTLSGLIIPVRGGIVLDMKRMNQIIEINELSRYALIEPGVSTGQLLAYLNEHHPDLQPAIPDAPPSATIAGNVLIHGSGYLSQKYGDHGAMVNGLEVVLASGEVARLGSCAVSDYWFARGPIPDLVGLFLSSFGTMGIVTKLSVQIFPKPKFREIVFGLMKDEENIPKLLLEITTKEFIEDVILGKQDKPEWLKGYIFFMVYITGDSQEDIDAKLKILKKTYRKNGARYMKATQKMIDLYIEKPIFASGAADFRKGGGFEYVGANMPLEKIPEAYRRGAEISRKYGIPPTLGSRLIGQTHNIVMFFSYSFNRADPDDMQNARNALEETNHLALELGGIPWKGELGAQKLTLQKMDPNYKKMFFNIRQMLDPNGIMNPGNWSEEEN